MVGVGPRLRGDGSLLVGFSLVEMSLVVMVVSLIIGGVLVGRTLIRQAELRSVTEDVTRYTQAVNNFRDKYLALPGDFTGSTALWGSPAAGCPNGVNVSTDPVTATCNGNGSGLIFDDWNLKTTVYAYESFRVWQHLSNAGMIDGSYTGVTGNLSAWDALPGNQCSGKPRLRCGIFPCLDWCR